MRQRSRVSSGGVRRPVIAVLWAAALAGLFAMHGLGSHGAGGHEAMTSSMGPGADQALVSPVAARMHDASRNVGDNLTTPSGTPAADGPAAMCLAILGGLATVLVALLARRRRRIGVRVPRQVSAVHAGRERDPPFRLRLSVMRC